MDRVVVGDDLNGFADMLAALIRGNLDADPSRASLLERAKGTVALRVPDVPASAALTFGGGLVRVANEPRSRPAVEIVANSEQMMSFSTVPRRFGMPDVMSVEGRALVKQILTGKVKLRGVATHMPLLRTLQELLSV